MKNLMKFKKALILGIFGQDGYLLSKLLKKKKYRVIGIFRTKHKNKKIDHIDILYKTDIKSFHKVKKIIEEHKPDEIYNFSGVSDLNTAELKILENERSINQFVLNLLIYLKNNKKIKFFNSLSSELFRYKKNNVKKIKYIDDFNPENPYAISKLSAFYYSRYFREKFNLNVYNGFLFNHDSIYRSKKFIIPKIIETLVLFKYKKRKKVLQLKNILSQKDFGSAEEYVKIIWKVLQQKKIFDFILGSENSYSLLNIIKFAAKYLKIDIRILNRKNRIDIYCKNNLIISGIKGKFNSVLVANNYLLRKNKLITEKINFNKVLINIIKNYKKNLLIEKYNK